MTTPDELVERVARVLCYNRAAPACDCRKRGVPCRAPVENLLHPTNEIAAQASASVAVALEEAAKVAEDYEGKGFELGLHTQSGDAYVTRSDIAAAIRAMIGKEPTRTS